MRAHDFEKKMRMKQAKAEAEPQVQEYFENDNQCNALGPSSAPMPFQHVSPETRDSQDNSTPGPKIMIDDISRPIEQSGSSPSGSSPSPHLQSVHPASPASHRRGMQAGIPSCASSTFAEAETPPEPMNEFRIAPCQVPDVVFPNNNYVDMTNGTTLGISLDMSLDRLDMSHSYGRTNILQSPAESSIVSRRNKPRPEQHSSKRATKNKNAKSRSRGQKTMGNQQTRTSSARGIVDLVQPVMSSLNYQPPTPNTPQMFSGQFPDHSVPAGPEESNMYDSQGFHGNPSYPNPSIETPPITPNGVPMSLFFPCDGEPLSTPALGAGFDNRNSSQFFPSDGEPLSTPALVGAGFNNMNLSQNFSSDAADEPLSTPALGAGFDTSFNMATGDVYGMPYPSHPVTPSLSPTGLGNPFNSSPGPGQTHSNHPEEQFPFAYTFPESFSHK